MLDSEYQLFFDLILDFKQLQDQQKQRGLNDYNILNVVRDEYAEVGLHSRVLYSLLDPEGLHYQKDLFLKLFIKEVLKISDFGDMASVIVEREEQTQEARRIDFTIKNTNYYIGIEMKLNAADGQNQLSDYEDYLKTKSKNNIDKDKVIIYYLSLDGKKANPDSSNGIKYKQISFEKDILSWIEKCQKEVHNITNLNQAFENYKWIVQKITKKYRSQVMSFEKFLENNKGQISEEIIKNVLNEIDVLQRNAPKQLFDDLENVLIMNNYKYERINDQAIDLSMGKFFLRLINTISSQLNHFTLQVGILSDRDFKKTADNKLKSSIVDELKKINKNFESGWLKCYGVLYYEKNNYQNKKHILDTAPKMLQEIKIVLENQSKWK